MSQAVKQANVKLDSISFDTLLEQQDPFRGPSHRFDLSGIRLITPAALVELAAACYALSREDVRPVIVVDDAEVRSYLLRSGFVGVIDPVARLEPEPPGSMARFCDMLRGNNPLLIEVTKIRSASALDELLARVISVLSDRLGYARLDALDVAIAVSEVAQNTFEHNHLVCGFFAMQVYGSGLKRFLEIGIADYGDGLAATLLRNGKNRPVFTDKDAIEQAMRLRTSAFDDPTHGTGLYHLMRIATRHGGSVQVRSGNAKIRYRTDLRRRWLISVPHMPGVQVALTLPTKESAAL